MCLITMAMRCRRAVSEQGIPDLTKGTLLNCFGRPGWPIFRATGQVQAVQQLFFMGLVFLDSVTLLRPNQQAGEAYEHGLELSQCHQLGTRSSLL